MASAQLAAPRLTATTDPEEWISRVQERAVSYYPELVDPAVRLVEVSRRPQSLLLRCELSDGELRRRVMLKIPTAASPLGDVAHDIPRVSPLPDPRLKPRMEFLALEQIHRQFLAERDPRFGSIRILDHWPESDATVMEEVEGSTLRALLNGATRLRHSEAARLPAHFETVGAWLARFQRITPHELCRPRSATRDEFLESLAQMSEFLASRTAPSPLIEEAALSLRTAATRVLPANLPLGLAHGDFAARNVLIDGNGKVTVIDTLARFQAPIHEDVGYFLNDLHTARLQTCTLGVAYSRGFLDECRKALLRGWSDDPESHRAVPLFEAQALLDRWCARVGGGTVGRGEFFLSRMHFSRRLRHLCSELTESA